MEVLIELLSCTIVGCIRSDNRWAKVMASTLSLNKKDRDIDPNLSFYNNLDTHDVREKGKEHLCANSGTI